MSLLTPQVQPPTGKPRMQVISGTVFRSRTPLANGASISTGWFSTEGFVSMSFVFDADQTGQYMIEYSDDQNTLTVKPIVNPFTDKDVATQRKGAIDPTSSFARITFTNNSGKAQTSFYMSVQLKTNVSQPSLETLGAKGAITRLAQWVKSQLQLTDGNGVYDDITRTANAMNVNVVNSPSAVDTSALAKDGTDATNVSALAGATGIRGWLSSIYQRLTNGSQSTQIVNGNNQPYGATDRPFNVTVSNPTPATDVSTLAKDATLTNGTQKTIVTNNDYAKEAGGFLEALSKKDFATQKTVADILAKLIVKPATEDKQDTGNTTLTNIFTKLDTGTIRVSTIPSTTGGYPTHGYYQPQGNAGAFKLIATGVRKLGVLTLSNTGSAAVSVMLYDKATIPVAGDTPVAAFVVQANSSLPIALTDGMHFNNGIGMGAYVGTSLINVLGALLNSITAGNITVSFSYV